MQSLVQVETSHCRIPSQARKQAVLAAALQYVVGQAAAGFAGPTRQARVIRREEANQKSFLFIDGSFPLPIGTVESHGPGCHHGNKIIAYCRRNRTK
jgi:hypothetical protein